MFLEVFRQPRKGGAGNEQALMEEPKPLRCNGRPPSAISDENIRRTCWADRHPGRVPVRAPAPLSRRFSKQVFMSGSLAISDENGGGSVKYAGKDSRGDGCEKGFSHQRAAIF